MPLFAAYAKTKRGKVIAVASFYARSWKQAEDLVKPWNTLKSAHSQILKRLPKEATISMYEVPN